MWVRVLVSDTMTSPTRFIRLLSDDTRREILLSLRDEDSINPFPDDTSDQRRIIQLHHVHLPLLAEYDLIEWDRDTGTVTRGENFDAVAAGLPQPDKMT